MSESGLKLGTNKVKVVRVSITLLYLIGMWPKKNSVNWYIIAGYCFQALTTYGWTLAKCIGTFMLEKKSDIILFVPSSVYCVINAYRGFVIMRKLDSINSYLNAISDFDMTEAEYKIIDKKMHRFSTTSATYAVLTLIGVITVVISPILTSERIMPVPIWLPYLDWQSSERDYYIGMAFSAIGIYSNGIVIAFTPIIGWYLLYASSLTLEVLGYRLQKIGYENTNQDQSQQELINLIKLHKIIIRNINNIADTFSSLFFIQISCSAACICSVTYLLATVGFNRLENVNDFIMYLSLVCVYGIDIFLLIFYANEITLASDNLSYHVYESNWTHMSIKSRKIIITFLEQLKKPQEIVVGKFFPLRMKLLSSILNMAYSIFNILAKDKQ